MSGDTDQQPGLPTECPNEPECTCMGCRHFQEQARMERLRKDERERIAQELRLWAASYEPGYGSNPVTFIAALADKLEGKDNDD